MLGLAGLRRAAAAASPLPRPSPSYPQRLQKPNLQVNTRDYISSLPPSSALIASPQKKIWRTSPRKAPLGPSSKRRCTRCCVDLSCPVNRKKTPPYIPSAERDAHNMSDEVSQFLEQVERLRGQQIEDDEVRARELEEFLAAKRERQARREGQFCCPPAAERTALPRARTCPCACTCALGNGPCSSPWALAAGTAASLLLRSPGSRQWAAWCP